MIEPFGEFLEAIKGAGLGLFHHNRIQLGSYMVAGLKIPGTDDVVAGAALQGERALACGGKNRFRGQRVFCVFVEPGAFEA